MLTKLKAWFTAPEFDNPTKNRQSQIAYAVLLLGLFFNVLAPGLGAAIALFNQQPIPNLILPFVVFSLNLGLLVAIRQGYTSFSSIALIVLFLVQAMLAMWQIQGGIDGPFTAMFFIPLLLAGFLFNIRAALGVGVVIGLSIGLFAYLETLDFFTPPSESVPAVLVYTPVFLFVLFILYLMLRTMNTTLSNLRHRETELETANAELKAVRTSLEARVAERTQNLEAVAALSERLARIQDIKQLQRELVEGLQQAFGYHQVQIYRYEAVEEQLTITAVTGRNIEKVAELNYSIPLQDTQNPVVQAVQRSEAVHQQGEVWFDTAFVSEVKAQIAVPIMLDEEVVGALNVYALNADELDENDVYQLRSVANQMAGILRNARTLTDKQQMLETLQEVQNRYQAQNWDQYRRSARTLKVQARQDISEPVFDKPLRASLEQAKQVALKQRHTFTINPLATSNGSETQADALDDPGDSADSDQTPANQEAVLVTPLMLGDQMLGTLGIRDKDSAQSWSENDVALIEAVAQQVAQALENARLFNETQLRASRERLTREITDKMRRAPDVESILQIGLTELTQVLGVSRSYVKLMPDSMVDLSPMGPEEPANSDSVSEEGE